jgi:hypothetical protein
LRVSHGDSYGIFLFGLWAEHSWQNESRLGLDLTSGMLYDVNKKDHSPIYFGFDGPT